MNYPLRGDQVTCQSNDDQLIEINGAVRDETERTIIFIFGESEVILPKNYIQQVDITTLLVPEWLAYEKGLL